MAHAAPRSGLLMAIALALSACGEIPQPFRHEVTNPLAVPKAPRGVAVRPLEGADHGQGLAEAMARLLVKQEIPASARPGAAGAYIIDGLVSQEEDGVTVLWWVRSPDRDTPASYSQKVAAPLWASADERALGAVAAEAVAMLSGPLRGEPAPSDGGGDANPPPDTRPRLRLVGPVGLPGDGDRALTRAMRRALERGGFVVRDDIGDYIVTGRVTVSPGLPGEQTLDAAWVVTRAAGAELGVANQNGPVPKGRLDQPWGSLADDIALGGAEGVRDILRAATEK